MNKDKTGANGERMDEDPEYRDLLAALDECHESTLSGLMHCLDEGGDFVEKNHIRWLLDCAEITHTAGNFLIKDSEFAGNILDLCACVAEDCAESCRKFFDDRQMKNCAEVCQNCADSIRGMITEDEEMAEPVPDEEENG